VSAGVPSIRRPSNARMNPTMQIRMIRFETLRLLAHDLRSSPALPSRDIERGLIDWFLLCEWIVRARGPDYYHRIGIGSEPESNPSNALAKNQRLIQVGIASDPRLEAASVSVILQNFRIL